MMKTGLEKKIRQLVEQESTAAALNEWRDHLSTMNAPPFNYRFDHVVQTVSVAKYLARETGADLDVVVMAAWLHDVARPGIIIPDGAPPHGDAGAEIAREFLLGEGVDSVTVDRVCDAIRKHVGYTLKAPLEPLEAQIVWEADKLTKVGLVNMIRHIINSTRFEPNTITGDLLKLVAHPSPTRGGKSRWEPIPLLREIAACMHTEPAKRLAQKWIQNVEFFIKRLESELFL